VDGQSVERAVEITVEREEEAVVGRADWPSVVQALEQVDRQSVPRAVERAVVREIERVDCPSVLRAIERAVERAGAAVVGREPEQAVGRAADRAVGPAREESHVGDLDEQSPAAGALRPERARAGKHTAFCCC
jgi:septum formation inhibitor-activating ATPase MinD